MSAEAKRRQEEQGKLVDDEQRGRGRIPLKTYQFFLAAFGVGVLVISTVSALLFEGSQVYSLFWLADWSTTSGDEAKFVGVYAAINMFAVLMSTSQGMAVAQGCSNAAISLHARLLEVILLRPTDFFVRAVCRTRVRSTAACVLTSACGCVWLCVCGCVCVAVCVWLCVCGCVCVAVSVWFYVQDTTPIGRVITRFAKDMTAVDTALGRIVAMAVAALFNLGRVLTTMAIATKVGVHESH